MLKIYTPVYALTLLISATLLFSVQPMFSKMILPLLGGTPQVWNTAMLFFQVCLLGGYAYAHGTSRFLNIRIQAIVHIALLALFVGVLPFAIPDGWTPPTDTDPTLWQLSLMAVTVGGPFFILAGSAPMLQRWFSHTDHPDADNPYFLYGASNLGSMTGLLAYPFIVEPLLALHEQSYSWMLGYFGLIAFTVLSMLLVWKHASGKAQQEQSARADAPGVSWALRGRWLLLAFIPSSLMLGVTTYITTDIASVPLLWILPLAVYVGTFILVFARKPLFDLPRATFLFEISIILLIAYIIGMTFSSDHPAILIPQHLLVFFFAALLCHTALAQSRPHVSHLTEFYLLMSLGGAMGGFFNAIIAPQVLLLPIEYALVLALCVFVRYSDEPGHSFKNALASLIEAVKTEGLNLIFSHKGLTVIFITVTTMFAFGLPHQGIIISCAVIITIFLLLLSKDRWLFGLMVLFILGFFPIGFDWGQHSFTNVIHRDRNFFGVIKVVETKNHERILLHGTTNHGAQALEEEHKITPLSYYSYESPINDLFSYYDITSRKQEIGVLGLGIGVTACFSQKNRHFDFYEIDPDIAAIAENQDYFTYLSDCGSPYDIILGDGRLTLAEKPDKHYDVVVVDVFSSDNIPVHIITKEAMLLYLDKIKDNGAVIFNISNNYLDLEPVVTQNAEELGVESLARISDAGTVDGTEIKYYAAHFFVMSRNQDLLKFLKSKEWSAGMKKDGVKAWSDQYSNIIGVLGNAVATERYKASIDETVVQE